MKVKFIISAAFYLLLSLGLKVNAHYCGGKLQSLSFSVIQKDCNKCGKKAMKGCCKDVSTSFDTNESNFVKTYSFSNSLALIIPEPLFFSIEPKSTLSQSTIGIKRTNAPPSDPSKPIYLKNSTFLI